MTTALGVGIATGIGAALGGLLGAGINSMRMEPAAHGIAIGAVLGAIVGGSGYALVKKSQTQAQAAQPTIPNLAGFGFGAAPRTIDVAPNAVVTRFRGVAGGPPLTALVDYTDPLGQEQTAHVQVALT